MPTHPEQPKPSWRTDYQQYFFWLIALPLLIFLYHLVTDQYLAVKKISNYFLVLFVLCCVARKWLKPSWQLVVFCATATVVYGYNYYIVGHIKLIPAAELKSYKYIINQYIWCIPLLVLPTLFAHLKFTAVHFFKIIAAACVLLLVYNGYQNIHLGFDRGALADFFNPIIPYNIGTMSVAILLLMAVFRTKGWWFYGVFALALAAMMVVVLQGSRGTWLGIPLVFLLICYRYYRQYQRQLLHIGGLLVAALLLGIAVPNSPMMERLHDLYQDYQNISHDSYDNSSGGRLVLWHSALEQFQQQPLTGVGMYGIKQANCQLQHQGKLPQCFQHEHSIVFHELAANGLVGLLGLLISFAVPLSYFARRLRQPDPQVQHLALTGIAFLVYYFSAGLTEYYLFFVDTTYWFYLAIASLMALLQVAQQKPTTH